MGEGAERITAVDVRVRVVAVALEPALLLARVMALPLDDLHHLVSVGYFREARARGMSLRAVARRFSKSLRTIATLSRTAGTALPALEGSRRIGLRRSIVARVAEQGAATAADLGGALPDTKPGDLREALEQLVAEGILELEGERYTVVVAHVSMVKADVDHRIDSLRHFLGAVTQVVYRRFFTNEPEAVALARVLTFAARREELAGLTESTYADLRKTVLEVDSASEGREGARQASVAVCFVEAPLDAHWKPRAK
jgi:hypothetical protein